MGWIFGISIAILIFSQLDDIIELFKKADPNYQKEKEQESKEQMNLQSELRQQLKESVGCRCQIENKQFDLMSKPRKIIGRILAIEEDWLAFEIEKNKNILILKVIDISNISKLLS